jgi:hypothetical protein
VNQIKEVASNVSYGLEPYRWQPQALLALQESAEHYLTLLFEDAYVRSSMLVHSLRALSPLECCPPWDAMQLTSPCARDGHATAIYAAYTPNESPS